MTITERIARVEAQQRLPVNVHPITERPVRRDLPRWMEWTQASEKRGADLTDYVYDGCGPDGRAA